MRHIDVCNGDADGLIARHQFRLSFPVASTDISLVTGAKREIALLSRLEGSGTDVSLADISVFDISYDQNAESARRLLDAGATLRYFDHHRASQLRPHPRLSAHIDTSASICTSLIVDRYLGGAHHAWAIAAAFGDNLIEVAEQLAASAGIKETDSRLLRQLGEVINYNAYGDSVNDLHYHPVEIARRMMPYESPFEFVRCEDVFAQLQSGFKVDLERAQQVEPFHASRAVALYLLPDESWARRVSGAFANLLVCTNTRRAHAVLSRSGTGACTVSIRAPQGSPQHADTVAIAFNSGGGRASAAGINNLPEHEIARLIALLEATYSTGTS